MPIFHTVHLNFRKDASEEQINKVSSPVPFHSFSSKPKYLIPDPKQVFQHLVGLNETSLHPVTKKPLEKGKFGRNISPEVHDVSIQSLSFIVEFSVVIVT
jgi:hypothetical protein